MMEVKDLWKMNVAKNLKLLAGSKGAHYKIRWMYVCQENDIAPWVQGGEVMIVYGAAMCCDVEHLVQLVRDSHACGIAAIIIMRGIYIPDIPEEMEEAADELEIPLFEISSEIPISCLTKEIADLLLEKESVFHRSGGDVLRTIIEGCMYDYKNENQILGEIGYPWNGNDCVYVIEFKQKQVLEQIHTVAQNLVARETGTELWFWNENRLIGLAGDKNQGAVKNIMQNIYCKIKAKYRTECNIGIGTFITGKNEIRQSYEDANTAIVLEQMMNDPSKVMSLQDFPIILQLIVKCEDEDFLDRIIQSTVGVLIQNDREKGTALMETLQEYVMCDGNIKEAAEQLYIHRNTMMYRIRQIESLTKQDMSDIKCVGDIMTGYYAYQYKLLKNTMQTENNCVFLQ